MNAVEEIRLEMASNSDSSVDEPRGTSDTSGDSFPVEIGADPDHRGLVQALNTELRMATVVSEKCLVPSLAKQSARDLIAARQLAEELGAPEVGESSETKGDDPNEVTVTVPEDEMENLCLICYCHFEKGQYKCCIVVCDDCVAQHIRLGAEQGQKVHCLSYTCEKEIPPSEWSKYLNADLVTRLLERRRATMIDRNPDARWCPNPACGKPVFLVEGAEERTPGDAPLKPTHRHGKKCLCTHCSTSFCRDCNAVWTRHHRVVCAGEDASVRRWALFKNTCRCPFCKSRIEKGTGCNHMTCGVCRGQFCWLCRQPYQTGHYDNVGGCFGLQYSPVNVYGSSKPVRIVTKTTLGLVAGGLAIGAGAAGCALFIAGGIVYGIFAGGRKVYRLATA